jgi:tellurite resistance protein TehA-like permease
VQLIFRAAISVWALGLVVALVFSMLYSYRPAAEQPRYFKPAIWIIRIVVLALMAAIVYLLSADDQVLIGVVFVILTFGGGFSVLRLAYRRAVRVKASLMTDSDDPFEVDRFRRTAAWMIDLEIKDGQRPR